MVGTFTLQTYLSGFQMVFDKMAVNCQDFQMPFEIQTICNPTSFSPFKIQNGLDFRSPLQQYYTLRCIQKKFYVKTRGGRQLQRRGKIAHFGKNNCNQAETLKIQNIRHDYSRDLKFESVRISNDAKQAHLRMAFKNQTQMSKMLFLAAMLYSSFEIQTFWRPS